jgi:LacI family transcriptional regulator
MAKPWTTSSGNASKAPRRATITDVARIAGVAPMTVSRVLTGSAIVSPDKASRIHEAMNLLRYRPNETARALRSKRSKIIGLIVPRLADPFFSTIAHAVNSVAADNGYSVLIVTSNDEEESEYSQAQMMVLRGVEGIVIVPGAGYHSKLNRPEFEQISLVALDKPIDEPTVDSVLIENTEGARLAVEHLIKHGHKRIACISEANGLFTLHKREEGYQKAMTDHDLRVQIVTDCTAERSPEVIRHLMRGKTPPTAILTTNGPATRNLLHCLLDLRIKIPEQLALIGFDDFEFADILEPSLTVVSQPVRELGKIAAMHMFEQLKEGRSQHIGKVTMLPVELVIRRSCGCKP